MIARDEEDLVETVPQHLERSAQHVVLVAHVSRAEADVEGALSQRRQVAAQPLHVCRVVAVHVGDDKDAGIVPTEAQLELNQVDAGCGWML